MSKGSQTLERYSIHLQGEYMDPERLDRMTRQLSRELLDLDLESVDFVRVRELPEGTKAGEAVTPGALAVAVLADSQVGE